MTEIGSDLGHRTRNLGRRKDNASERLCEREETTHIKYRGIKEIFA